MRREFLKQAEAFAFLASFFLIGIILIENKHAFDEKKNQENPPIIILAEKNESYRFPLGSAAVPYVFREALKKNWVTQLDEMSQKYDCDAIEVVGHTDGVHISRPISDFDDKIIEAIQAGDIEGIKPGSNMDLGMMRALAIIKILKESQRSGQLKRIKYFFPYSAGQMIMPDRQVVAEDATGPDLSRRRIEIRLLKSETRRIE